MVDKISEKRISRRVRAILRARFFIEGDSKPKEGLVRNISLTGLIIKGVDEAVPISSDLEINIYSPRLMAPIKVKGKVVRIEEEEKLYNYGVAFVDLIPEHKEIISHWARVEGIDRILSIAVKHQASDVHLVSGQPPVMRVFGELHNMGDVVISPQEIQDLVYSILNEKQKKQFEELLELDMLYVNDYGRFRVNVHKEKNQMGAVIRYIATEIKSIKELSLPTVIADLALKPNGLIIVAGPMGSGKSTTMAAMIDLINREKKKVVVSLEEPIEYLYKSRKSLIIQREVGIDTHSFVSALKHVVRQDTNVIMIGELRDIDSISFAISAAETGSLVLTTLPTSDVISTINRILDVFPPEQQSFIRTRLSEVLRGIICQMLLPRVDVKGRVVATEVLVTNAASCNIVRKGNLEDLRSIVETGSKMGMHTMKTSIESLYDQGKISHEDYQAYLSNLTKI